MAGCIVPVTVFIENEQVGWRETLAVRQVDEIGDGTVVDRSEQGKQVGGGPAAGWLGPMAGPVLVLAEVRGSHRGETAGVESNIPAVGVDPTGSVLQAPPVSFPPGGAGAQTVAPGELGSDLPVTQPHRAHPLTQVAFFFPQASFRVRHRRRLPVGTSVGSLVTLRLGQMIQDQP
jgi:hypothetical protein